MADTEGRFHLPRRSRPFFAGGIEPVYLVCLAPGYKPYRGGGVEPQPPIVRLRPLTQEERHLGASGSAWVGSIPDTMLRSFETSINVPREQMGLSPIKFASGDLDPRQP